MRGRRKRGVPECWLRRDVPDTANHRGTRNSSDVFGDSASRTESDVILRIYDRLFIGHPPSGIMSLAGCM